MDAVKIMAIIVRKILFIIIFFLLTGTFFVQKANAASLTSISDRISTSRPSASAPLNANQAASAGQVTINDNGSIFLASDSAVLWPDTGETLNTVNVASMSAQISGTPNTRIVYFTNTAANTHHAGDPITTAITAKHTVVFTTISTIPVNGKIIITFPGSGNNTASPSATTFAFNNLQTGNVTASFSSGTSTCTFTVTAPSVTCTVATAAVNGAVTVTITIGSSTPALINPTKTAAAGSADTWKVSIKTQDTSLIDLDTGSAKIATIESVQVQATVEPTITFTIAGLANSANYQSSAASCGSETSNSGIDSTATFVNLGILNNGGPNKAGQTLTVSTNGSSGYAITATSSGRFINPASGVWLPDGNGGNGLTANDTPVPLVIPANGTAFFGISPCGADVPSGTWSSSGTTMVAASAKVSNPWNTGTNGFYATIASNTSGAVSNIVTVVRYGAEVTGTTPAGIYSTVLTYVATATF